MVVNFKLNQYPDIIEKLSIWSERAYDFLEKYNLMICGLVAMIVLVSFLYFAINVTEKCKQINKTLKEHLKSLIWNDVITYLKVGYVAILTSSMLLLKQLMDGKASIADNIPEIIILVICIACIGASKLTLYYDNYDLDTDELRAYIGSLYTNLRYYENSPRSTLYQPSMFFTRRFLFCLFSVMVFSNFPWG